MAGLVVDVRAAESTCKLGLSACKKSIDLIDKANQLAKDAGDIEMRKLALCVKEQLLDIYDLFLDAKVYATDLEKENSRLKGSLCPYKKD